MTTIPQLPRKSAIRGRVLGALCNLPPFSSRDEVSRAVKLNPQQVSAAISHLRVQGLVEPEENRPRYGYRVRVPGPVRDACYAAGWMGTKHPLPTPPPLPLPKPAGGRAGKAAAGPIPRKPRFRRVPSRSCAPR